MWRVLLTLPFIIMVIWAWNMEEEPLLQCVEWEEVTVTFNGQHIGNGHIGPAPRKVKTCTKWLTIESEPVK